jgi:DNA-binding CsgD family transcriptional regulator
MGNSSIGSGTAVPNYEVVHFVGRADELRLVKLLLSKARGGSGSALALAGRSGFGKTRFLQRCGEIGAASRGTVLRLYVQSHGPKVELAAQIVEKLALADMPCSDPARADFAYDTLVAAAKRGPLLILVDDIHFASSNDIATLEMLIDSGLSNAIVVVASFLQTTASVPPNLAGPLRRWLGRGLHRHELPPLSSGELGLLARNAALSITKNVSAGKLSNVLELCGGNPRYALQLLNEDPAEQQVANFLPYSATTAVASLRLTASQQELETLAVAAIANECFLERWLQALLPFEDAIIGAALQIGVDVGLLRISGEDPAAYTFIDRMVQRSLAVTIVPLRRKLLHAKIATMLLANERNETYDELIAEHWHAAGQMNEAVAWLARAAAQAAIRKEHRTAARLYEHAAADALAANDDPIPLWEKAASCYENAGAHESSLPLRRKIVVRLNGSPGSERYARAIFALFLTYGASGHTDEATETAAILRTLTSASARDLAVQAALVWATWLFDEGRGSEAKQTLQLIHKRDCSTAWRSRFRLVSALADCATQPVEQSLKRVRSATDLAEKTLGASDAAWMLIRAANLACRCGRLDIAKANAERADRTAAEDRTGELRLWTTAMRAEIEILAGDLNGAQDLLAPLTGVREAGALWEMNLASLCVFIGLRTGATVLIDAFFDGRMVADAVRQRQSGLCGMLLRGFAEVMAARGLSADLSRQLRSAVERRFVDPLFHLQIAVARFGPLECVEPAREELCRKQHDADGIIAAATLPLFDAFVAKRSGDVTKSRKAAALAAVAYRELGWRLHVALSLELEGNALDARLLYEQCGATRDANSLSRHQTRKGRRAAFGACLTPREREVAKLACADATNPEIARQLGISERTIHHHMECILSKLGIRSRWQLSRNIIS